MKYLECPWGIFMRLRPAALACVPSRHGKQSRSDGFCSSTAGLPAQVDDIIDKLAAVREGGVGDSLLDERGGSRDHRSGVSVAGRRVGGYQIKQEARVEPAVSQRVDMAVDELCIGNGYVCALRIEASLPLMNGWYVVLCGPVPPCTGLAADEIYFFLHPVR